MATTPRRGLAIGILLFASFMDLLDVTIGTFKDASAAVGPSQLGHKLRR